MDDVLLYGPWVLSAGALLLATSAWRAAARAKGRAGELERTVAALRAPPSASVPPPAAAPSAPPPRVPDAGPGPCPAVLEERLGALEARLATLATTVRDAATPPPDEVAPMRPPVPSSVEPVAAPRSGWRMFP